MRSRLDWKYGAVSDEAADLTIPLLNNSSGYDCVIAKTFKPSTRLDKSWINFDGFEMNPSMSNYKLKARPLVPIHKPFRPWERNFRNICWDRKQKRNFAGAQNCIDQYYKKASYWCFFCFEKNKNFFKTYWQMLHGDILKTVDVSAPLKWVLTDVKSASVRKE